MSAHSSIEWTDATWNPVTGCTKISAGCDNCYAERFAERFRGVVGNAYERGFDLTVRPERLEQPLRWRKPRMVFVNSMSDLFHKDIPDNYIDRVFDVAEKANWHTFQILTKRSSRMRDYVSSRYGAQVAPSHIWIGVSVELSSQKSRLEHLRSTPAACRFLSFEPLLGAIGALDLRGIHWVIAGGESGPGARVLEVEWVTEIRDQCIQQRKAFFFKQWGGRFASAKGRILEGRLWNEFPSIAS